jgi:hypothetical protein
MGRGRKPEERSILAGTRLERATKLFGKSSITALVDDQRWLEIVKIFDDKTIRTWIKKGIPLSRLYSVSQYFNVSGDIFSDKQIDEDEFNRIISQSKSHLDNPNTVIPVVERKKEKHGDSSEQLPPTLTEYAVLQTSLSELKGIRGVDASTSENLVNISKTPGMHIPVIDFLKKTMNKPDPAERHWVYITLGLIGSDRAKVLVEEGLNDGDEFARSGAERAMKIINDNPNSKGGKNEK